MLDLADDAIIDFGVREAAFRGLLLARPKDVNAHPRTRQALACSDCAEISVVQGD